MGSKRLPTRLNKEPLIDALFECRFDAKIPASSVLPGIFFSELKGQKRIERLPHIQIPEEIRNTDPNLQYAHLIKVWTEDYSYMIGDRSVAVACNMPYKKWANFRNAIILMLSVLKKSALIDNITRYSIKYVDLIESLDLSEQATLTTLSLSIGNKELKKGSFQVRMEIPTEDFINVIQIVSGVSVTLPDNTSKDGLIIDVDTIRILNNLPISELERNLEDSLDKIHSTCKTMFFDCLTDETLNDLGPEYE